MFIPFAIVVYLILIFIYGVESSVDIIGNSKNDRESFKHVDYPDTEWIYNPKQFEAFEKIIARLKDEKIRFILVYAPIASSLYKSYTNQKAFDKKMSGFGDYYNFNVIIQLDDSLHFYDADHLNRKGVEVLNENLLLFIPTTQ